MTIKNAVAVALAVACILAFAWFGSSTAKASPLPDAAFIDKAEELAQWIDDNSDYGPMSYHPAYVFAPPDVIHYIYYQTAGGYSGQTDTVTAIYHDGLMWLPEGYDPESDPGILLHEMVHHLQFLEKREYRCVGKQEVDAYRLQAEYMADIGRPIELDPMTLAIVTSCREDWQ